MCSSQVIRNSSIYVFACVLIAALGYIQFGFTCDYSSPTKAAITKDLSLTGVKLTIIEEATKRLAGQHAA
ncbi:BnaA01g19370D [Brassica napus]|uniref:BnaA01g19370D protein n=2 Tax=Brassica TaxID=3705 RepID=A0A078H3P6_BRANA|nr:BnaA01g19370D [Brassica napus]